MPTLTLENGHIWQEHPPALLIPEAQVNISTYSVFANEENGMDQRVSSAPKLWRCNKEGSGQADSRSERG